MHGWIRLLPAIVGVAVMLLTSAARSQPAQPSGEWAVAGFQAIDLGVSVGFAGRIDEPPRFPIDQRFGAVYGAGFDVFLSQRISFGLAYEHVDLASEDSGLLTGGTVAITRDLNNAWLNLRLYPYRDDRFGMYLRLAAAMAWQSAELSGSVWPAAQPGLAQPIACEEGGSAGFGVRAEAGVDAALSGGVRVLASAGPSGYLLSDDVLDQCIPGAGSATLLGLRIGLVYGLDL